MYIPEEMQKENKFIDVAIPSNRSFFQRLGSVDPSKLDYSGDVMVSTFADKLQADMSAVEFYQKSAELLNKQEESKSE